MKKWFKIVSSLFLIFIGASTCIFVYFINNLYIANDEDYYLHEPLQNGIGYIQDGKIKVITFDLSYEAYSEDERQRDSEMFSIESMNILVVIFSIDPSYLDKTDCNETYLDFNEKITSVDEANIESNQYGYKTIEGRNKDNLRVEKGEIIRFYLALKDLEKDEYVALLIQPKGFPKYLMEIQFKPL